jgi:membrane protease YdiL (CAAX protease family)
MGDNIKKNDNKRMFSSTVLGVCLVALALLLIGSLILGIPFDILKEYIKDERIIFILEYFLSIGVLLSVLFYIKKRKENNYMLKKLSFKNNKILLGLLIGFVLNGICILAAYLNNDIVLSYSKINVLLFIISFFCVAIQSTSEELLCRLFIYQKLKKNYKSPFVWIFVSSTFFGIIHIINPGITVLAIINIVLYGVLMSIMIYYFDNIWMVCAIHTAWNFMQNIIFGFPNSGMESKLSMFKLISSNNSFYYDKVFGIEGSIFVSLLLISSIIIVNLIGNRKKNIE